MTERETPGNGAAEPSPGSDGSTPDLVVVCGLPGVGKTTVAETVADRLDATVLRSDVVRKDLVADPEYSKAETERVYAELFRRARGRVADGGSVVLDATFQRAAFREEVRAVAADVGAPFRMVKVECDQTTVEERIRARTDDESDADVAIHRMFRDEYDELTGPHVVVDNSGSVAEMREQVADAF
ncbi:MAG: AAA family ATPase [Halolamina sp.]